MNTTAPKEQLNEHDLEQIAGEIRSAWEMYRMGVFTFQDVVGAINTKRGQLGLGPLDDGQERMLPRLNVLRGFGL